MSGYVKLYRKSIDNGWLKNANLWVFWCYCLMKATHKKCKALIGFTEVHLEPGQFIFGRVQASKDTGLSEQTVRTCLLALKSTSNITIKSTNKFSIISVVNWERYQVEEEEINQQINQQTNQQLTSNQPTTNHIQEVKKLKKKIYVPYDEIQGLYNETLSDLPEMRFFTDDRKKSFQKCWIQEPGRTDSIEFWKEFFEFVSQSDFLMGRTKDPWTGCDFEWLTKRKNFIKVREGKYNR